MNLNECKNCKYCILESGASERYYVCTCKEYSCSFPEIICGLYEYLHRLVTGSEYDYMWHWANKCGAWVDTFIFDEIIENIMKEGEKNEDK